MENADQEIELFELCVLFLRLASRTFLLVSTFPACISVLRLLLLVALSTYVHNIEPSNLNFQT